MDNADFNANRPTVPQAAPQQQQHVPHNQVHKSKAPKTSHGNKWLKGVIALVILIIVFWGGVFINQWLATKNTNKVTGMTTVDSNSYQAVFLTNGQVYFGKLTTVNQYYVTITNVFYLQVQQSVQPASNSATTTTSTTATNSSSSNNSVQLVKLGNELHGPQDEMTINRPQVLFWENLKSSGKVTQAINNYYQKQ